jgi:hypothetical protein
MAYSVQHEQQSTSTTSLTAKILQNSLLGCPRFVAIDREGGECHSKVTFPHNLPAH